MKISSIINVAEKESCFSISSFKENSENYSNCIIDSEKILPCASETLFKLSLPNGNVKQIYNLDGEKYLYFGNGKVYKLEENRLVLFAELFSLTSPTIIQAPSNFGNSTLLIDENNFIIRGDTNGAIFMQKGDGYLVFDDMVFAYENSTLYFASKDNDSFLLEENYFGRIDVNSSLGKILYLAIFNNNLYVVSEYGISTLSIMENKKDFKLKEVCAIPVQIKPKSIKQMGEKIYFISGNKLCVFSGGRVDYKDFLLGDKEYAITGDSVDIMGRYCVQYKTKNKDYLYCYNSINMQEENYDMNNLLISEGGYFFNTETNELGILGVGENSKFTWESKFLDFGNIENKFLHSIEIFGSGCFEVQIIGDKMRKTYKVIAEKPLNRLSIYSKKFKLIVKSIEPNSLIEKIKIKYRY